MKFAFLLLGIVVLALVVVFGLRMKHLFAKSAELVAQSKAYEQYPENPTFSILVMGDSTAVGTGSADPRDSVAGRFGGAYPQASIENRAANGARIADIQKQLDASQQDHYDFILIHAGANNILNPEPYKRSSEQMDRLLQSARQKSDRVVLLTSGNIGTAPFFPLPLGWYMSGRTKKFHSAFIQSATKHTVVWVNLWAERTDDIFLTDPDRYYGSDYLHLSGDGYGIWYDSIRKAMTENNMELPGE